MKKVYIAIEHPTFEGSTIRKVFEKEEDAKQHVKQMQEKDPIWKEDYYYIEKEVF